MESAFNYAERFVGLRSPQFKYLIRERDGREEFYDLSTDPGETRDLADIAHAGRAASFQSRKALVEFREQAEELRRAGRFETPTTSEPKPIDEASRRALESLGYMDRAIDPKKDPQMDPK